MAISWDRLSSTASSSAYNIRSPTALEQLLEEVNFQRKKERRKCIHTDGDSISVRGTPYWTDLFVRHFLFESDRSIDADDLLFFVRKKPIKGPTRYLLQLETEVEVFRRDSRKLPIGDPDVAWEETLYLNLVIHQFEYTMTLAVCTRTSPKDIQVLKRHCQRVYASPSRRRMDMKGDVEEITYPNVCFMVDNFDEAYEDILVRDGEMVCVELVATNRQGVTQGVLFLGSIRYEVLKKVYDSRASLGSRVAQKISMGLWSTVGSDRMEFVRMKGPQGKGHAEMAVTRPKDGYATSGYDTPCSEPGTSAIELHDDDWDSEPEELYSNTRKRRLSEPSGGNVVSSATLRPVPRSANVGAAASANGSKSRSESEGLDRYNQAWSEIEAGDLRDELDDGVCNPLWTMKGFTQTFHFWKESRRAQSVPLNALLTYVTVPWYSIIADILDHPQAPILSF